MPFTWTQCSTCWFLERVFSMTQSPLSSPSIMAILFSGIVMSHYTHHNLSPVTQILMQQTLRTVAFLCETCVFAFLGLSIFSFPHKFEISFVIWCIVLVLFGRAVNIFPLSYLLNFFRDHKITPKMMFIMWFSGLRGAIPYALSLHLDLEPMEKRQLIGTTTIIIVLFTILLLGGSTMPLIRLMDIEDAKARRRNKKDVNLSKTEKMVSAPWAREWDGGLVCTAAGKWGNETRFDDLSTYTHIYQLPASEGGWSPEAPCELFASLWPHGGKGTQPTFSVGSTGLSAAMSQPRPCWKEVHRGEGVSQWGLAQQDLLTEAVLPPPPSSSFLVCS
uniref:Solute carrier family 9 member A8 n=1 Tax=Canis lupus familiaris TaxID=9615 RepID=A0A8P0NZR2_CANLF